MDTFDSSVSLLYLFPALFRYIFNMTEFGGCSGFFRWLWARFGQALQRWGRRAEAAADPGTSMRLLLEEARALDSPTVFGDLLSK